MTIHDHIVDNPLRVCYNSFDMAGVRLVFHSRAPMSRLIHEQSFVIFCPLKEPEQAGCYDRFMMMEVFLCKDSSR